MAISQHQYTYDPVSQTYTRIDTPAANQGLGSLYDLGDISGGAAPTPSMPGPNDARFSMSPFATEVAVGMQNFGQFHKTPGAIVSPVLSTLSAISEAAVPGRMGTISPVEAPVAPVETAIAPTQTANLQALNEQTQTESEEAPDDISAALASIASTPGVADVISDAVSPNTAVGNVSAPSSTDAGGGAAGPSGAAGVSGANDEASHEADGNNPGSDSSSDGGCFLTTAAVRHMGQKDNGEVLNTLRRFRDTYMKKDKEKSKDVQWYYTNAPRIMRVLDARKDAGSVYKEMYNDYVLPAYRLIKEGKNAEAYAGYKKLVNFAKRESGIDSDELTPKPKHYAQGGGIMTFAQGGVANPQGILRYDYDPTTQQYTLTGREGANGSTGMGGISPLADLIRQTGGLGGQKRYDYNPQTQTYTQKMAKGGVASAQHAQSMGRGNDTMLVHMTPGEVGGLQALANAGGGSLTINPNTGLPEAGFLSAMLPTIAGMALAPYTGGMSAALMVGAGYTAATGSLKKGLMAGLGAFGGANIGSGLGAAGQVAPAGELATAATPATSAATTITPDMIGAPTTITPEMLDPSAVGRFNIQPTNAFGQNFAQLGGPGAETVTMGGNQFQAFPTETGETVLSPMAGGQSYYVQPPGTFAPPPQTPPPVSDVYPEEFTRGTAAGIKAPTSARPTYDQMGRGLQNLFDQGPTGEQARKAFGEKAGYSSLASAAAPLLSQERKAPPKPPGYIRRYNLDVANRSSLGSEYTPGSSYEREMMDYTFTPQTPIRYAASGGLTSLASGGQPKFLSGGGDGMSDSIPANISGTQEARLSDGEFVVPADVVSHLGNGSSKAGAKKLYKMMDRIRQARTGKKSQAPEVKAESHMPA